MKHHKEVLRRQVPFTITSKRMKYLGINLPTEAKDLCSKKGTTLMKETDDDAIRWKDTLCSWIERISVVKMIILPNLQIQCNLYQNNQWHFS